MENGESKIRKVLFNEVALFMGLMGAVLSIVFWISNPQQELRVDLIKLEARIEVNETISKQLQNIKDNDLHSLQKNMDDLKANQIQFLERMVRLETLIKNGKQ